MSPHLPVTSSATHRCPFVYPSLSYDTARDSSSVTPLANLPTVLVGPAAKSYKTCTTRDARHAPIRERSTSLPRPPRRQLNAERFRRSANFQAQHIPFKGASRGAEEVIAGRVDFYFSPIAPALPHSRDVQAPRPRLWHCQARGHSASTSHHHRGGISRLRLHSGSAVRSGKDVRARS